MLKDLPLCLQTSTDAWAWCYVKRSSLVLAQTLDATLQGAGLSGGGPPSVAGLPGGSRPGGPYHPGGRLPGRRPGPYIYIFKYYT